ncbi:MAG: shikimate kinase [Ferruginibacter sp.]|nr:shikimate kinase [Ferruginibacter sp.]
MDASKSSPFIGLRAVFLIGFMGSGKTHWGKIWAAVNQLSFVDLDEVIENKAGKSVAAIFDTMGEDHFRELEAAALRTCIDLKNTIVACGGGTPCFYDNMQWMNDHGTTIYITCTFEEIYQRILAEKEKRPLLKKINRAELIFFIEQKLKEREPFYKQAKSMVQSSLLTENSFPGIIAVSTT